MQLHTLKPAKGSVKKRKRIGRGTGSGYGGTSTKGHKGAQSRSGYKSKPQFEGGQMPLQRRIPKRGFKSRNKKEYALFNLGQIAEIVEKYELKEFSSEALREKKLVKEGEKIKILAKGELGAKLPFKVSAVSDKAKEAIEKSGSSLEII